MNQKTCDDLKFPDKTFFNCYFRERRISAPPFANPKPMDAFLTQNATDIVVLTCYLQKHYYYSMNSVDGSKNVLYNDCISIGKYSSQANYDHQMFQNISSFAGIIPIIPGGPDQGTKVDETFLARFLGASHTVPTTVPHLYPWQCSVRTRGFRGQHRCGATLLSGPPSKTIIVSAAHCNILCKDELGHVLEPCCCREIGEAGSCRDVSSENIHTF